MPRWKALPEELDPEIREFAGQMRQLVDRGGLSLAAVSDKTGYSKTSWERYLNGRLLPPQGAVSALAEVTGTDVRHLATMWELAERAWSRAEMRHDMTMEAIRISQAREALAKASAEGEGRKRSWAAGKQKPEKPGRKAVSVAKPANSAPPAAPSPAPPAARTPSAAVSSYAAGGPVATGERPSGSAPTDASPRVGAASGAEGRAGSGPGGRTEDRQSEEPRKAPWPSVRASDSDPGAERPSATVRIPRVKSSSAEHDALLSPFDAVRPPRDRTAANGRTAESERAEPADAAVGDRGASAASPEPPGTPDPDEDRHEPGGRLRPQGAAEPVVSAALADTAPDGAAPADAGAAEPAPADEAGAGARTGGGPEGGPLSMTNTGPADLRKRPGRPEWPESWPVPEDDERGPVRTDAARTAASTADALPGATADRPDPAFANFGRSGTFDDAGRAGVRDGRPAESEDGRPAGSPADGRPSRPEWSARLSGVPARPPEGYESTTVLRRSGGGAGAGSYAPAAASPAAGRPAPPGPPGPPAPASDGGRPPSKGRRTAMMLAGAVGALAVIAGAVFLLDLGGGDESAKPEASASPSEKRPELPDGVKCVGEDCAGEDPELMGCGGQYAETTSEAMVGNAYVEVRYSKVCNAAWARVGTATPGTTVTVEAGGSSQDDEVADSNSAYTKMVAAKSARAAEACVETAGGLTGCTNPTP